MENLELYEKLREVPENAQKKIGAGRLKGMTDINPMWRIKMLTQEFGACGFGWYIEPVKEWLENGANGEITANVEIKLYIKQDGEWSKGIVGIGGSKLVAKETSGLFTSDECYKMAYTDAISVACKMLGMGADVYWQNDRTKYTNNTVATITDEQRDKLVDLGVDLDDVAKYCKVQNINDIPRAMAEKIINKKEQTNDSSK